MASRTSCNSGRKSGGKLLGERTVAPITITPGPSSSGALRQRGQRSPPGGCLLVRDREEAPRPASRTASPAREQRRRRPPRGDAHQQHDRGRPGLQRAQHGRVSLFGVPGDHHERRREPPVGEGNSAQRRRRDGGGNPGHDLAGHARRRQGERFLAAATEDERIAALQPHHALAAQRPADHHALERLADRSSAGRRACPRRPLRPRGARGGARRVDQRVVEHQVGRAQTVDRAQREQLRDRRGRRRRGRRSRSCNLPRRAG